MIYIVKPTFLAILVVVGLKGVYIAPRAPPRRVLHALDDLGAAWGLVRQLAPRLLAAGKVVRALA